MIQLRTNYVHTIKDRQINTIENITGTSAFFGTYHVGVGVVIVRISTAVGAVPGVRLAAIVSMVGVSCFLIRLRLG